MARHAEHTTRWAPRVRIRLRIVVAVILAIAVVIGVTASAAQRYFSGFREARLQTVASGTENRLATRSSTAHAENPKDAKAADERNQAKRAKQSKQRTLDALSVQLQQQLAGYQGTWQVYVEDLPTGASISINSHEQYSASVIKLMVMLAVFQQIADGALQEDAQIDDLLTRMITVSDNEATNTLVDRLGNGDTQAGYAVVNGTAQRYGFTQSHLDQRMGDLTVDTGKQTSVGDQGRFLAAACRGQLVSVEYSQSMIGLMLQQTRRSKIPAGVPSQVSVANKTGESPGVENDSAMVFAAGDGERIAGATPGAGDYVMAVMSENVPMPSEAQNDIRTMSSTVWSALQ